MTHTGRTATVKLLENRYTFRKQEHKSLCVWLEIKKWNGNRYHFLKKKAYIDPTRMSTVLLYTSDPLFSRPSAKMLPRQNLTSNIQVFVNHSKRTIKQIQKFLLFSFTIKV